MSFSSPYQARVGAGLGQAQALPAEFSNVFSTQRENDTESSLMHFRARSYDPRTGRFIQTDPQGKLGYPGSRLAGLQKQYTYASNNPVSRTDPMGLDDPDDPNSIHHGKFHRIPKDPEPSWNQPWRLVPSEIGLRFREHEPRKPSKFIGPVEPLPTVSSTEIVFAPKRWVSETGIYFDAAFALGVKYASSIYVNANDSSQRLDVTAWGGSAGVNVTVGFGLKRFPDLYTITNKPKDELRGSLMSFNFTAMAAEVNFGGFFGFGGKIGAAELSPKNANLTVVGGKLTFIAQVEGGFGLYPNSPLIFLDGDFNVPWSPTLKTAEPAGPSPNDGVKLTVSKKFGFLIFEGLVITDVGTPSGRPVWRGENPWPRGR